MITAIVQFKLPQSITLDEAKEKFQGTAPKYQDVSGLIRKYYLFEPDDTVIGVYLWEDREAAEVFYSDDWRRFLVGTYGAEPDVRYYETPVIVDNTSNEIIVEAA